MGWVGVTDAAAGAQGSRACAAAERHAGPQSPLGALHAGAVRAMVPLGWPCVCIGCFLLTHAHTRTRTQIEVIMPSLFKSFHDFGTRYCGARQTPYGYDYSGAACTQEVSVHMHV